MCVCVCMSALCLQPARRLCVSVCVPVWRCGSEGKRPMFPQQWGDKRWAAIACGRREAGPVLIRACAASSSSCSSLFFFVPSLHLRQVPTANTHIPTRIPTMFARNTIKRAATAATPVSATPAARAGHVGSVRQASTNAETDADAVANSTGTTGEPEHLAPASSSSATAHNSSASTKKYVQLQQRRVSNTWNIPKKDLFLDMLFTGQGPLLEPVKVEVAEKLFNSPLSRMYVTKNGEMKVSRRPGSASSSNSIIHHSRHAHTHPSTVTEDLARYRAVRTARRDPNHNVFFSTTSKSSTSAAAAPTATPTPSARGTSIFTHSAVSGLSLENNALLNLPHSLLLSLQPFSCRTQPGNESYRDDRIVVRKLQIEEKEKNLKNKK